MSDRLPFAVPEDSKTAFATAYTEFSGASSQAVTAIVNAATDWHRTAPVAARTGHLAPQTGLHRRRPNRDERQARRACRRYVCQHAPSALGILGWIQIGLWIWRNRHLIAEIIRLFREFLADRPATFQAVMKRTRIELDASQGQAAP